MKCLPNGEWTIESIVINERTVLNDSGFRTVEFERNKIRIQPSDMEFEISQANENSAVLASRGQIFYANFEFQDNAFSIDLSRPKFKETIRIELSPSVVETPTQDSEFAIA